MIALLLLVYPYLAWGGTLIILVGVVIAGIYYRGRKQERYSLLNHFISELGEVGISKKAAAFNIGMILGGILFLPLMVGLGLRLNSIFGWLGTAFGLVAAISATLVGVYSMERLTPHRRAAMTFFRSGLLTVLFFTIAIFTQSGEQKLFPMGLNIIGIIALASYSTFLLTVRNKMDKDENPNYILDPQQQPNRPRVWRSAVLEWSIFFFTLLWFVMAGVYSLI
jgi:hypothetical membrane protein